MESIRVLNLKDSTTWEEMPGIFFRLDKETLEGTAAWDLVGDSLPTWIERNWSNQRARQRVFDRHWIQGAKIQARIRDKVHYNAEWKRIDDVYKKNVERDRGALKQQLDAIERRWRNAQWVDADALLAASSFPGTAPVVARALVSLAQERLERSVTARLSENRSNVSRGASQGDPARVEFPSGGSLPAPTVGDAGRRNDATLVLVDGSNVANAVKRGGKPSLDNIRIVREELERRGFRPMVFVDASLRHQIPESESETFRQWEHAGMLSQAPAGVPADLALLQHADARGAAILTNDRFLDHRRGGDYAWLDAPGRRIPFSFLDGSVTLFLATASRD